MTELNITLREAVPSDAKDLIETMTFLNQETPYLVVSSSALNMSPETMASEIDYIYNQPNQFILLAFNHDEIIGVATIVAEETTMFQHVGELGITIKKDYWGLGLGSVMIDEIISLCAEHGIIKRIEINVQLRNSRAIHLYEKMGFIKEGIKKWAFCSEDNTLLDVVLMSKLLF